VVAAVAAAVRGRAKVQTGGGVRSAADAEALAAAGVARVVMGSAAIKDRTLVAAVFRIVPVAVGLDHRDGDVALHGWTQGSGLNVMDLLDCYPDAEAFIITNIARDGMLTGPDIEGLAAAAAASPIPVIASGGVSSLDDLRVLNRVPGLAGVITGKAIYENRFTVGEALETLAEPS
jgi:phosphoribosylformimino-5-aminoimidazole carboxamide ribotide isomerase